MNDLTLKVSVWTTHSKNRMDSTIKRLVKLKHALKTSACDLTAVLSTTGVAAMGKALTQLHVGSQIVGFRSSVCDAFGVPIVLVSMSGDEINYAVQLPLVPMQVFGSSSKVCIDQYQDEELNGIDLYPLFQNESITALRCTEDRGQAVGRLIL